jgi:hypothetical protein
VLRISFQFCANSQLEKIFLEPFRIPFGAEVLCGKPFGNCFYNLQTEFFWVVTPCNVFWDTNPEGLPKRWYPTAALHGIKTRKISLEKTLCCCRDMNPVN